MWMPTHVQVTVQRASGLLTKGKNSTNDCFVTIALGKTKYQTSVKEKAEPSVEWHEECELPIPEQGNKAEIILTALHRNFVGVDEFLGRVAIPLNTFDIYERPKNRWYTLESKPGKEKKKERGKLEVKIGFIVKSGSLTDLRKKERHKSSIGQLSHVAHSVGGSLLSLGSSEKKGLKKFAKSIGTKLHLKGKKKDDLEDDSSLGSSVSLQTPNHNLSRKYSSQQIQRSEADPGVISEDEDEFTFDDLSHKSSASSINQISQHNASIASYDSPSVDAVQKTATLPISKGSKNEVKSDEWETKLFGKQSLGPSKVSSSDSLNRRSWDASRLASQIEEEKPGSIGEEGNSTRKDEFSPLKKNDKETDLLKNQFKKDVIEVSKSKSDKGRCKSVERVTNGTLIHNNRIPNELLQKFEGRTKEDLILTICDLQRNLDSHKRRLKDLEDYLDDLLLRVMETTPRILQNPYVSTRLSHSSLK